MKKLKTVVVLVLVVVAGLLAQPNMGKGQKMDGCELGKGQNGMMSDLKLTADQQKKMDELQLKFQKNAIDQHAAIQKKAMDKRQAMQNEDYSAAKILTGELFGLKEEFAKQKISQHEEMMKILTPEQQAKFKELRKDRSGRMHHQDRMGKHNKKGFKGQVKHMKSCNMME